MDLEATTLWKAYRDNGDQAARERIVEENMRLVHHVAHKIRKGLRGDIEFDELVDAGCIGLLHAIDSYDPDRGLAFSTFAFPRIRGAILDDLRKADVAGRDTRRRQRMIAEAEREVAAESHGVTDSGRVAEHMNIDVETLHRWKAAARRTAHVSLDKRLPGADGEGPTIGEVVADFDADDIEEKIGFEEESAVMRKEFHRLNERERIVLMLYYFDELKLREIAEVLGITESRVSQIRTKALQTLRTRLRPLREEA
jgi:RNA polymerase sigma factor for flagellar operon FliA